MSSEWTSINQKRLKQQQQKKATESSHHSWEESLNMSLLSPNSLQTAPSRVTGSNGARVLSLMEVLSLASSGIKPASLQLWKPQATTRTAHPPPCFCPWHTQSSGPKLIAAAVHCGPIAQCDPWTARFSSLSLQTLALHFSATAVSTLSHPHKYTGTLRTHTHTKYCNAKTNSGPFFSIYTHKILLNKSVKLPEETTQYIYANLFC